MSLRFRGAAAPIVSVALVCAVTDSAVAQERCRVTDPTGTPLNVRSAPNGRIVGKLPNDALVSIRDQMTAANGKSWVFVARYKGGKPIGWVFREFVSCF